jgi:hypothetical protein
VSGPAPGQLLSDVDGVPVAVVAGGPPTALADAVEAALANGHPWADHTAIARDLPTTPQTWRLVRPGDADALADDCQPGWLAPTGTGPARDVVVFDLETVQRMADDPAYWRPDAPGAPETHETADA